MVNDILKTLQAMESELTAIKSAKEQVESVIAADSAINSNLKSYADSLSCLSDKLNLIKDSIEGITTTINDETGKFSTSLKASKTDIELATNKLSGLMNEFKTQTEVLGIKSITEITQQIQLVCEEMKTRLTELELRQKNATTIISESVDNSNANLKKHTDNAKGIISQALADIKNNQNTSEQSIKNAISAISKKIMWICIILIILICIDIILHFV